MTIKIMLSLYESVLANSSYRMAGERDYIKNMLDHRINE